MGKVPRAKRGSGTTKDAAAAPSAATVGFEAKLWAAADKLLPKLFSAEIRVYEAEQPVEEVTA